jgi:hypothetical protein
MAIKDDVAKVRWVSTDLQMMAQSANATKQPIDTVALAFAVFGCGAPPYGRGRGRVELMESERRGRRT